jgi:hypothetical protein
MCSLPIRRHMQISALFRTLLSYKVVIAIIFLASTIMANAAEPKIVKDAVEAADWMAKALSSSGYKADFTLDSLKEVDRFVDDQAPGGNPKSGGLLSDHLGARVFALGAYVGEVIRRQGEGQWRGDDNESIWPFS